MENFQQTGLFIFFIGLLGAVGNFRNFLLTMMSIELTYLGIIATILCVSAALSDVVGRISSLTILAVTASESALGLGILVVLFRYTQDIRFSAFQALRG